ncbi:MAG TPA: DUF1801 domain-containing protein [Bacteroidales bacterium]|nr:DUF1801 domain-containing protein [Bacteroidales bacterium]
MNTKVNGFLEKTKNWRDEFEALRRIILDCNLEEELKWGFPCYTFSGKNIVLIHGFKDYCAMLFFKGALLKDPQGILIQQTENVQAARQIRFTNSKEIEKMKPFLKAYVSEAVEVEKAGLKISFKKTTEYKVPAELQDRLDNSKNLKNAFEKLTPGRQRAYIHFFSQPKQQKTREARVEKYIHSIMQGKGLND